MVRLVMAARRRWRRILLLASPFAMMAIGMGWMAAVFLLMPDADWDTQSLYLMPFPMVLAYPIALNIAFALDVAGKTDLRPRVEIWTISACALAVSYASSLLPASALEATILTMILGIFLWLAAVQGTRRRAFQSMMRRRVARKLGASEDDPEVKRLANNQDLPHAMVAAALVTVQVWLLTSSDEFVDWLPPIFGVPQTFPLGSARTAAWFFGSLIGGLYHRYCPNQTEIRELAPKPDKRNQ